MDVTTDVIRRITAYWKLISQFVLLQVLLLNRLYSFVSLYNDVFNRLSTTSPLAEFVGVTGVLPYPAGFYRAEWDRLLPSVDRRHPLPLNEAVRNPLHPPFQMFSRTAIFNHKAVSFQFCMRFSRRKRTKLTSLNSPSS